MVLAILERINHLFKKGKPVNLLDFISNGVICFLNENTRDEAVYRLVELLDKKGTLIDKEGFFQAIKKREKIVSTAIGMGVAIPHAKLSIYKDFFIAIGIQQKGKGLDWEAPDDAPVRIIFLIGGPASEQTKYLKILSSLTASVKVKGLQQHLLKAKSKEEIIALFKKIID